jgi:hypothetical protein
VGTPFAALHFAPSGEMRTRHANCKEAEIALAKQETVLE